MAAIFLLSSQSGLRVSQDDAVDRPLRALAHAGAYATLAGLVLGAMTWARRPTLRDAVVAVAIAVAYGISDEIHQSLVPDRSGRSEDVLIDAVGAVVGVAVTLPILRHRALRARSGDERARAEETS